MEKDSFIGEQSKKLEQKSIHYEAFISSSEDNTRQFIAKKITSQSIQAIGVIGGDGTISSVIQEVAHTTIPLAIFPTGSRNDTARMFQLTNDPQLFIEKMCLNHIHLVDLIRVNHRFGVTVAGIGIDTVIGDIVNRAWYKPILNRLKLGTISYIIGTIQVALTFQPFQTTITSHGKTTFLKKTWLLTSGNRSSYGGGLTICPDADPTDGQLNITIFHSLSRFKALLLIFPALLTGKKLTRHGISYLQVTELNVATDRPISAILDGEMIT